MRRGLLFLVVLTGALSAGCASGRIGPFAVLPNFHRFGAIVTVSNDADRPFELIVNGITVDVLEPGERWSDSVPAGYSFNYQNALELTIKAKMCSYVRRRPYQPPSWSKDKALLGEAALTEEFLRQGPAVSELRRHVTNAKNTLRNRDVAGRKQMEQELDQWFNTVRKYGFNTVLEYCEGHGPEVDGSITLYYDNYRSRAYALTVRRSGEERRYYLERSSW